MPRKTPTRTVTLVQVTAYLAKAEEYAAAADDSLTSGRLVAATSLAIHAGINAGDVVTGVRTGSRAAGQDHDQAVLLLRQAGDDGQALARELGRLLPLKTKAEYSAEDISRSTAERAVERARRCVVIAQRAAVSRKRRS